MTFQQGQRVTTPLGAGHVAYQRMAPPDYRDAEVVSVVLDAKRVQPNYSGTIFPAELVTPVDAPPERAACRTWRVHCERCSAEPIIYHGPEPVLCPRCEYDDIDTEPVP